MLYYIVTGEKMLSTYFKAYRTIKFGVQSILEKEEKKNKTPFSPSNSIDLVHYNSSICSKCGQIYSLTEEYLIKDGVCLFCKFPDVEAKKVGPQEIRILPELIDTSKLEVGTQKSLWRPSDFSQYIGQESLKDILNGYIRGCKEMDKPFPHFLVDGKAGTGKTTIAYILASKLGLNFKECLASTLKSPQQLIDLLVEVNGGILLIDEIQTINKQIATFLLPLLEDFKINGQYIKPFTMMACTTEKGILLKKWKPLVDRCKIQKTLDPYTIDELAKLLKQYKDKTFKNINIDESIFVLLAKNARGTPRVGIRLLESYIYMQKPLEHVFKAYNIVKNGVTTEDIKVLKLLEENPKGIGLNSICAYLQTSVENFMYQQESYLIELGLMTIGNRRQITTTGKEFLTSLKG
jgi:holliday junction DNA helicase RuvB